MTTSFEALPGGAPVSGLHGLVGPLEVPRMHFPLEIRLPDGTPVGTLWTDFDNGTRTWDNGQDISVLWSRDDRGDITYMTKVVYYDGEPILVIISRKNGTCALMARSSLESDQVIAYERTSQALPRTEWRSPQAAEHLSDPELSGAPFIGIAPTEDVTVEWPPHGFFRRLLDQIFH